MSFLICTLFLSGRGNTAEPSSPSRLPCSSEPLQAGGRQHPTAAGVYSSLLPSPSSQSPQLSTERLLSFLLHSGEEMEVQRGPGIHLSRSGRRTDLHPRHCTSSQTSVWPSVFQKPSDSTSGRCLGVFFIDLCGSQNTAGAPEGGT